MRITSLIVAPALAVAGLAVLSPTAMAACPDSPPVAAEMGNFTTDGQGEVNTNATAVVKTTRHCNGAVTQQFGYYPNRAYNARLYCDPFTRTITIDPQSWRGYNAAPVKMPCRATGYSVAKTFTPSGTDRTFGATVLVDRSYGADVHARTVTGTN